MVGITGYSKYTVVQHHPLSTVTVYYLSAHMGIIKWLINTLVYLYSIYIYIYIPFDLYYSNPCAKRHSS